MTRPATVPARRRPVFSPASVAVALGLFFAVAAVGQELRWRLPKASSLFSQSSPDADDWCEEHGVPESICVECRPGLLPPGRTYRWCKEHGIPECPLCHPEIAELSAPWTATDADRELAARSLAFLPREENDGKCKKHLRRIQLGSAELVDRLGIQTALVGRSPITETISATGEIEYETTRVARVAPRQSGIVYRVERQPGDKVQPGDVLALIDSVEVGRSKAEFQQALVERDLRRETVVKLRPMAGATVPFKDFQAAEAAVEESELRVLIAEQSLANIGLPVRSEDVRTLSPTELSTRLQFLGLPDALANELRGQTRSNNLLPVRAPLQGEVTDRFAAKGEAAAVTKPLFVVADMSRMMLTLRVRQEDASRITPGLDVRFRHPGHSGPDGWDMGKAVWVSPAADEKTRTVSVRVDLLNPSDRHHVNTFGTAEIIVRSEAQAIVVPADAVHWEGCCHVVFVQDRSCESPAGLKVFHVRKVRMGARNVATRSGLVTEIAVGLAPGEIIATTGSGVLRSELLKNNLGEGCACCSGK